MWKVSIYLFVNGFGNDLLVVTSLDLGDVILVQNGLGAREDQLGGPEGLEKEKKEHYFDAV